MKNSILAVIILLQAQGALSQNVGIGITTPDYLLDIRGKEISPISLNVLDFSTSASRIGITSQIFSNSGISSAISGAIYDGGGGVSGIESRRYALIGQTNTATAVAGYSVSGTALRGNSTSGLALETTGLIKLEGIGEDVGKILTSDAVGNATWQDANLHNHFGQAWSGNTTSNGLLVTNSSTTTTSAVLRGHANGGGTNNSVGVSGVSNSTNGIGIWGINSSEPSAPGRSNCGVVGTAGNGTGVYGASISGYSVYGFKSNTVTYTGTVARFENQNTLNSASVVQIVGASSAPALELNNGFLKVSGTNKTAFKHVSAIGNISSNITYLTYDNPLSTDIILFSREYQPKSNFSTNYFNKALGVFYSSTQSKWGIYTEDVTAFPVEINFNILVIRQ